MLVVGIGNPERGDDAVGLIAARRLREASLPGVEVIELSGVGVDLLEAWSGHLEVIIIDAVRSGAKVGTIHTFEAHLWPIPAEFFRSSTHTFCLAEAVELARALKLLPERLIVYGIEGERFEMGTRLSPSVEEALEELIAHVMIPNLRMT